ncbi:hypothetical protein [Falsiroseomonas sp. E2-1-a20]|uniref:hypothetical protein n=1 Tax=Falsiroseomonas sp. E2-1-a20 TaxID=3239300 RepID=UPI003F2C200B
MTMARNLKSRGSSLSPEEAIRIAAEATPDAPPAVMRATGSEATEEAIGAFVAAPGTANVISRVQRHEAPPAPPSTALHVLDPNANSVLSHRYREASLMSIARVAKARGMTQKQLLSAALVAFGVELHPADLGVRPPIRRRLNEV